MKWETTLFLSCILVLTSLQSVRADPPWPIPNHYPDWVYLNGYNVSIHIPFNQVVSSYVQEKYWDPNSGWNTGVLTYNLSPTIDSWYDMSNITTTLSGSFGYSYFYCPWTNVQDALFPFECYEYCPPGVYHNSDLFGYNGANCDETGCYAVYYRTLNCQVSPLGSNDKVEAECIGGTCGASTGSNDVEELI